MNEVEQHRTSAGDDFNHWRPLTFQQQYYCFLQEGGNGLALLDGVFPLFLSGPLDLAALRRSVEELIQRHDSLRTTFSLVDGTLMQRVVEPFDYPLEVVPLPISSTDTRDRGGGARRAVEQLASKAAPATGRILFTAKLLRLHESEHVLFFAIHHLISDHVSRTLLLRELWMLYGIFRAGGVPPSTPRLQFSAYRAWQEETQRNWLDEYREHWMKHLKGATGIQWPGGARPAHTDHGPAAVLSMSLSVEASAVARNLAAQTNTLLSIVTLAVYVALVARLCGQTDIVIATSTTGRDRMEFQHTVGCFAHPLYLRVSLTGRESFMDLLDAVRQEYYRALLAKDFGGLVLDTPELLSGTLFQWFPSFGKDRQELEAALHGLNLTLNGAAADPPAIVDATLTRRLDLMLIFAEAGNVISGIVFYRPGAFAPGRIRQLLALFAELAARVLSNPLAAYSS
jgi:hypothetical protein